MAFACRLFLLGIALAAVPCARGQSHSLPVAYLVDGRQLRGRLLDLRPDWSVRIKNQVSETSVRGSELASWGEYAEGRKGPLILLTDGGRIVADVIRLGSDDLTVESAYWSEAKIPLEFVRGIVLRPPSDSKSRDELLARVTGSPPGQDQLFLDEDRLAGTIVGTNRPNATFDRITIRPRNGLQQVEIKVGRISAVAFNPAISSRPKRRGLTALVGFRDGSHLHLERIERRGDELRTRLGGGIQMTFAPLTAGNLWDWTTSIRPWHSRLVYLSDLKPLAYRHRPYLTLAWQYQRDRNVLRHALRHSGKLFSKGIGMHSRSRIAYELNGRYRRFDAELAIDDEAGRMGSVVFRVYLQPLNSDRSPGDWALKYQSPVVRGGDARIPVSLDVKKVFRMALIVDYADRGDERDYANWLNARLLRE